ncbi:hypothetical protein OAT84_02650 [Gammaproteobacteria bacterium]|nr:hypothetical protein [Gammaproteobacteria bacterium]
MQRKLKAITSRQSIRGVCPEDYSENHFYRCGQYLGSLGFSSIVIARDPRPTSTLLYQAFIAGLRSMGCNVYALGVMPTPIVSFCVQHYQFSCGVMITASHNPVTDNGIKIFSKASIKKLVLNDLVELPPKTLGKIKHTAAEVIDGYIHALKQAFPKIERKKCGVDHANGAWGVFSEVLTEFIEVKHLNAYQPEQINKDSGIFHPKQHLDQAADFDVILMVDGDADRMNMITPCGKVFDGDDYLYQIFCNDPDHMVGTVMSNAALETIVQVSGYHFYRTDVGDDLVANQMHKMHIRYGGEPCGHIIDLAWLDSSDPVYLALKALSFGQLRSMPNKLLQQHLNLPGYLEIDELTDICKDYSVRFVVRHSNTEKLTRVMIEGNEHDVTLCYQAFNHQTLHA